jgi:hypothetical protein
MVSSIPTTLSGGTVQQNKPRSLPVATYLLHLELVALPLFILFIYSVFQRSIKADIELVINVTGTVQNES